MASTDARPVPQKNVAYRVTFAIFDADGDLVTGATGLDSEISKDAGVFADCTNEATEIATASGMYYLDLTATEMNADTVAIIVKTTSTGAKTSPIVMYPEEAGDIRVNATQMNGTNLTARDIGASVLLSPGVGAGQLDITSGVVKANLVQILGTVLTETAGQIAGGFKKLFDVAAPVFDLLSVKQTGDSFARIGAAGAGLTTVPWNAAWDAEVQSEVDDAIKALKLEKLIGSVGTLVAAGGHTINILGDVGGFPANADVNNFFNGHCFVFLTGTNAGAVRKIISSTYQGATGQHSFSFNPALGQVPSDGDTILMIQVADELMRGTNSAALASVCTSARLSELDAANIPADIDTLKTRVPDTISLANIAASVWDRLTSALTTVGSIGKLLVDNVNATISSRSSHSAADVWTSATRTLTSFGTLTTDAAAAVWDRLTSALATVGSIGKLLVDNINATISSRATQTSVDTITTNVAAILDDTGTSGVVLTAAERNAIADALLSRDMSLVAGVALDARVPLNALRVMRNKVTIVGTTMTVYKEDDVTVAWTGTITTDATALPITASDPT